MPNEPENNMDKLLKAYAQKRRDDAAGPFEMHGATRQLLQSEVARTIPRQAARPQGWRKLFSGFWSGLAWGGSMVAVLAFASLVWFEKGPSRELARNTEEIGRSLPTQQSLSVKTERAETTPKSSIDLSALRPESQSEQKADAYSESSVSKPESAALRSEAVSQRVEETQAKEALAKAKSPAPLPALQFSDKKTLNETIDHLALKDDAQIMKNAAADAKLSRYGLALAPASNTEVANGVLPSTIPEQKVLLQTPGTPAPTVPDAYLSVRGITVTDNLDALDAPRDSVAVPGGAGVKDDFSRNPTLGLETKNQPLPNLDQALPQDSPARPEQSTQVWAFYKTQTVSAPEGGSNAVRLYFSQGNSRARFRQNFNSPPYPNILTAFQVQRNGDNLSIVDSDGSVYEGTMEPSNTEGLEQPADKLQVASQSAVRRAVAQKPAQGLSSATSRLRDAGHDQSLSFRATGTNRSLNQKVVFTGNFLPGSNSFLNVPAQAEGFNYGPRSMPGSTATRTDQTAPMRPALAGGVSAPNPNSPSQQQSRLGETQTMQWGRIEGKASVGGKSEYRIEAIRVGP